ncbi:MAG: 30S ribosome-binding factor RbfA [bacterium]
MFPDRIKRVEREIQRVLAELLREAKDVRLSEAAVTAVEVTKDLRTAQVLISVLHEEQREATLTALQRAAGHLGHRLGEELDLRRIPKLTFAFDPTLASGARIDAILARVVPADPTPEPETSEDSDTDD